MRATFLRLIFGRKIPRNSIANISTRRYNRDTPSKTKTSAKYMKKLFATTTPMFKRQLTFVVIAGFVFGSGLSIISIPGFGGAQSIDELRQQTEELEREIEETQEQVEERQNEAASLERTIANYDSQISAATQKINELNDEINRLERELEEAEAELERQKELLKMNMRALYRRGGASTVELLMASDSFSSFIDEQEYLERLKDGIQDAANEVMDLQEQMEEQKEEQESLLSQQEVVKANLASARADRENLLDQTRGEEARFRELVEELEDMRKEAEQALAQALAAGSFRESPVGAVSAGDGVGTIGNSGLSSGPHLHLEVRVNGSDVNPAGYIEHPAVEQPPTWVSQGYGVRSGIYMNGYHPGIDYAGPIGTPIRAIDDGMLYRGCSNELLGTSGNPYGYVAIVEHSNGAVSIYAHMDGGPPACSGNISPW